MTHVGGPAGLTQIDHVPRRAFPYREIAFPTAGDLPRAESPGFSPVSCEIRRFFRWVGEI